MNRIISGVIKAGISNEDLSILTSNRFEDLYQEDERRVIGAVKNYLDANYGNVENFVLWIFCIKFIKYYLNELTLSIDNYKQDYISVVDSSGDEYEISLGYFFEFIKNSSVDHIIFSRSDFNDSLFPLSEEESNLFYQEVEKENCIDNKENV